MRGDRQRLMQVLMNIGGNAVKYTDSGKVRLQFLPANGTSDPYNCRFEVHDTGIGMHGSDRERIFHSFTQASTKSSQEKTT